MQADGACRSPPPGCLQLCPSAWRLQLNGRSRPRLSIHQIARFVEHFTPVLCHQHADMLHQQLNGAFARPPRAIDVFERLPPRPNPSSPPALCSRPSPNPQPARPRRARSRRPPLGLVSVEGIVRGDPGGLFGRAGQRCSLPSTRCDSLWFFPGCSFGPPAPARAPTTPRSAPLTPPSQPPDPSPQPHRAQLHSKTTTATTAGRKVSD